MRHKNPNITEPEIRVLKAVREYTTRLGFPPSIREIMGEANVSSSSLVSRYLKSLDEKGYLVRYGTMARAIKITMRGEQYAGT